jgi:hypothetical protein
VYAAGVWTVVGRALGAGVVGLLAAVAVAAHSPEEVEQPAQELAVYELQRGSARELGHELRLLFANQPGVSMTLDEDSGRVLVLAPHATQVLVGQAVLWLDAP